MEWSNACKIFDEKVFEDYNLFCIFVNSIDTTVVCSNSDSIINQFAKWIDNKSEFPDIGNKLLADKLQSKYDKIYKSRFILDIKKCLDDFKDCFDNETKPNYWGIHNTEDSTNLSDMFEEMRKLGEGLSDARHFYG